MTKFVNLAAAALTEWKILSFSEQAATVTKLHFSRLYSNNVTIVIIFHSQCAAVIKLQGIFWSQISFYTIPHLKYISKMRWFLNFCFNFKLRAGLVAAPVFRTLELHSTSESYASTHILMKYYFLVYVYFEIIFQFQHSPRSGGFPGPALSRPCGVDSPSVIRSFYHWERVMYTTESVLLFLSWSVDCNKRTGCSSSLK